MNNCLFPRRFILRMKEVIGSDSIFSARKPITIRKMPRRCMRAYNANTPHKQTNAESTFFAHAPGQRGFRCYLPPPSLMHNKLAQSERAICDNNKIYITPSSWTRDFVKCAHNVYRAMIHNVSTGADCDGSNKI